MPVIHTREKVIWKGVELQHRALTWEQDFDSGLPEAVGISGATGVWSGSFEVIRADGELLGAPSPYQRAYPRPGDRLKIVVTYDDKERIFTPVVDDVTYTLDAVKIDFVQDIDRFNQGKIRIPPLVRTMPRTDDIWGAARFGTRYPNPSPMWHADHAFRKAGFFNTPPASSATVFEMTCQGAVWANNWVGLGNILEARGYSGENPDPGYRIYDGAIYLQDAKVTASWPKKISGSARLSFVAPAAVVGEGRLLLIAGFAGHTIEVKLRADRSVDVLHNGQSLGGLSAAARGQDSLFSLCVYQGRWELATENTRVSGETSFTGELTGIEITAGKTAAIAGIHVDAVSSLSHRILTWKRNLEMNYGPWTNTRPALPSVRDATPRQVLDEVAAKTLSAWWVDAEGIAHFESAQYLAVKPHVWELDATKDISSYTFTDALLESRSSIEVTYSVPAVSLSNERAIPVWDGGGGSATAGDRIESFASFGDEEEWIDPSHAFEKAHANPDGFNTRRGSWSAASKQGASYDAPTVAATRFGVWGEQVTPWVFKIFESYDEDCSKVVPELPGIKRDLWGLPMPVLRARGKVAFVEDVKIFAGGPAHAPALTLDMTRYITNPEMAAEIAEFLGALLFDPRPYHSVTVPYNPFYEMGQVLKINGIGADGRTLYGATLRAQILKCNLKPNAGTTEMVLRILEETVPMTWAQVEAGNRAAGLTWAQLEATRTAEKITWEAAEPATQSHPEGG